MGEVAWSGLVPTGHLSLNEGTTEMAHVCVYMCVVVVVVVGRGGGHTNTF